MLLFLSLFLLHQTIGYPVEPNPARVQARMAPWSEDMLMPGMLDTWGYGIGFERLYLGYHVARTGSRQGSLPYIEVGLCSYHPNPWRAIPDQGAGVLVNDFQVPVPYVKAVWSPSPGLRFGGYASWGQDLAAFLSARTGRSVFHANVRSSVMETLLSGYYIDTLYRTDRSLTDLSRYPEPWIWITDLGVQVFLTRTFSTYLRLGFRFVWGDIPEDGRRTWNYGMFYEHGDFEPSSISYQYAKVALGHTFGTHWRWEIYAIPWARVCKDSKCFTMVPFQSEGTALFLLNTEMFIFPNVMLSYVW